MKKNILMANGLYMQFVAYGVHTHSNLLLYENVVVPGYLPKKYSKKKVNKKLHSFLPEGGSIWN